MATSKSSHKGQGVSPRKEQQPHHIKSNYCDTISIAVGKPAHHYTIHEDLICRRSGFFKAAVTKEWHESVSKSVALPEQNAALFKFYIESIYTPTLNLGEAVGTHRDELRSAFEREMHVSEDIELGFLLVQFWILGDYLGDTVFKNTAMRGFWQGAQLDPLKFDWHTLLLALGSAQPGTGLYKLCIDSIALDVKPEDVDAWAEDIPPDAIAAILKQVLSGVKIRSPIRIESYFET